MRELFAEVLDLQLDFSSENTPNMERRGKLIRNIIPEEMREWSATQVDAAYPFRGRLNVQGRDGTGRKTYVPWVRIHSPELSPSAQKGWYVVYLFHANGDGVSLCISHGSTSFNGREFVPRSETEVSELMDWARGLLSSQAKALGFTMGVDLGSEHGLSGPYERTTAFSKFYSVDSLPDEENLQSDAERAVGLLGELYRSIELGRAPEAVSPDVQEAEAALQAITKPQVEPPSGSGQGFGLKPQERRAVELRAMAMAKAWLEQHGYDEIKDVSANESCDYWAINNGVQKWIEVKGTTAGFGNILMTSNEVKLHREFHPDNVLIIVHNIDLVETRTEAAGGHLVALEAWDVKTAELRPLSYSCNLAV